MNEKGPDIRRNTNASRSPDVWREEYAVVQQEIGARKAILSRLDEAISVLRSKMAGLDAESKPDAAGYDLREGRQKRGGTLADIVARKEREREEVLFELGVLEDVERQTLAEMPNSLKN